MSLFVPEFTPEIPECPSVVIKLCHGDEFKQPVEPGAYDFA